METVFIELMKQVGTRLNLGELEIRESISLLALDDNIFTLQYLPTADQIILYTDICPLPAQELRLELYSALLHGQAFYAQTAGASLAINEDLGYVLLHIALPMRLLDIENTLRIIDNFNQVTLHWKAKCAAIIEKKLNKEEKSKDKEENLHQTPHFMHMMQV